MTKTRRILSLLLSSWVAVLLAACGGGEGDQVGPPAPQPEARAKGLQQ